MNTLSTSLIVPTYKRHQDLPRLIKSIQRLSSVPDELVFIVGPGDIISENLLVSAKTQLPFLEIINSDRASVIYALNLGLKASNGDILCLLDDDVELPTDWLDKIKLAFYNDHRLGAYGGIDYLQHPNPKYSKPDKVERVGYFSEKGVHYGLHHCGIKKSPAEVAILKGCNISIRRTSLSPVAIDSNLEGFGAESSWEIDLCQNIAANGFKLIYDNENFVKHYIGPRLESDIRTDIFSPAVLQGMYNLAYVYAKYRPPLELTFFTIRTLILGSRRRPGLFWGFVQIPKYGMRIFSRSLAISLQVIKGIHAGLQNRLKN